MFRRHIIIDDLARNVLAALTDWRLWISVPILFALTWAFAAFGIDAAVNQIARQQSSWVSLAWSAFPMLFGIVAPALIPCILWLKRHERAAVACLGALIAALIVVSALKGFTARLSPEAILPESLIEKARAFRFGLLEAGLIESVVEGWPSGHAATNTAVALTAMMVLQNRTVWIAGSVWIAWVFAATVFGIQGDVHWLSDSLAGLTIGVIIAHAAGSAAPVERRL